MTDMQSVLQGCCLTQEGPQQMQELEQLRQATQALKQDVDLLRANQEKQRLQEESLVLTQLRKTVQALQAEGSAIDDQKLAVGLTLALGKAQSLCRHDRINRSARRVCSLLYTAQQQSPYALTMRITTLTKVKAYALFSTFSAGSATAMQILGPSRLPCLLSASTFASMLHAAGVALLSSWCSSVCRWRGLLMPCLRGRRERF